AVSTCKQAYQDRKAWVPREEAFRRYQAAVALASKQHKKPPAAVVNPGSAPAPAAPNCQPPAMFGIAAADLVPATGAS
ncbi:MAG TPA: hypothetical protein VMF29_06305, partial [Candidatus Edwardsbacteria bacterium]|nr:hypothetical protein [Candidatus Edwardsbacteria bacterium]